MTPQPLSKEQLQDIRALVENPDSVFAMKAEIYYGNPLSGRLIGTINELLAAEAYWREAVKNAEPAHIWDNEGGRTECLFCRIDLFTVRDEPFPHKEDCAWRLANQ